MTLRQFFALLFRRRRKKRLTVQKEPASRLEPLESRIAPATLVNAHIVTYKDTLGDLVTIKSSLPIFTSAAVADSYLTFNTGNVTEHSNATAQELQSFDLNTATGVAGESISVTTVAGHAVNVGVITSNLGLGSVLVQGDLQQFGAGGTGIGSLTVNSLGAQATSLQTCTVIGNIGSLTVKSGNMQNIDLTVEANTTLNAHLQGDIGTIHVSGSLNGGSVANSGYIVTTGSIGTIYFGGSILGGAGASSGEIVAGTSIGSLTAQSIIGYSTGGTATGSTNSGSVITGNDQLTGALGSLTLTGTAAGQGLIGGDGANSGEIMAMGVESGAIGSVHIAGSLTGGSGANSGEIDFMGVGAVSIGKGIIGNAGANSGSIVSSANITSLAILSGGIQGGTAASAGSVSASGGFPNAIGTVVVHGGIAGNAGNAATGTGEISASVIGHVTVYGSITGGEGETSGAIVSTGAIGSVAIHSVTSGGTTTGGSIMGGTGTNSGEVTGTQIGSMTLDGMLTGGSVASSGQIASTSGNIGSLSIAGGIAGGAGMGSGEVLVGNGTTPGANLGSLHIASGGITPGAGDDSGTVSVGGAIGSLYVSGALGGNSGGTFGNDSGSIITGDSVGTAYLGKVIDGGQFVSGNNVNSLTIGGDDVGLISVAGNAGGIAIDGMLSGTNGSGEIEVGGALGKVHITGPLQGGSADDTGSIFAALDGTSKLGTVVIGGGVSGGAGDLTGQISSGGSIGSVSITGNLAGGGGQDSGQIVAYGPLGGVALTGALQGSSGAGSGSIVTHSGFGGNGPVQGDMGSISIGGGIAGGTAANAGQIASGGYIKSIVVTGSVTGDTTGSGASGTGSILAGLEPVNANAGDILALKITGSLIGGDATAASVDGSGYISGTHLGSVTIGGAVQSGQVANNHKAANDGAILASQDIAALSIGSIVGNSSNPVVISAVGQATPGKTIDLAIGKITVGSNGVDYANFLAGYDPSGNAVNGSASIGAVVVKGNWTASNLVAGVEDSGNPLVFGNGTDSLIDVNATPIARIASVIVEGNVETASGTFAFAAHEIDAFSVAGHALTLHPGYSPPDIISPVDGAAGTTLEELIA